MRVILVRHGDILDPANFYTDLTELGIKQIEHLVSKIGYFDGPCFSSPYKRCMTTATIIKNSLRIPLIPNVMFGEVEFDETLKNAQERAIREFERIRGEDEMIIVSHGGIIQGIALSLGHPDGICDRGQMLEIMSNR